MMIRKGIILAGGTGSRLHPSTISVSKQLMPVFDKPMIYYPLSTLMQAGLSEIMVITTPHDRAAFEHLLGDGRRWGMSITYASQPSPDGLAQALIIAEDFLEGGPSALILGDNLFFGAGFNRTLATAMQRREGATIFGYHVKDPSAYGVVGFDENKKAVSLVEKPKDPASNYAVTGLYFYDGDAPSRARQVKPSARGELEITTLNEMYLDDGKLTVELLNEGSTWLDTGTHRSLLQAAQFVAVIQERQGNRICCPEVIAYQNGWIDRDQLRRLAGPLEKSGYGSYLRQVCESAED
ncbi:glucose-1-phosphate thymidylyltransferase [Algimonas porphyrae]|uniref:Glucose-1-phosphate thymidylyltransferase n=2 Tax=Algimonas porphyrae TaxID=1128113 RepID=A0ABQ5V1L8_9PROT|nr:glucose-1-phosphate thymidylyltransferase RfbA [Algimonas porphyrae]GLQ20967.1 glucose-1-phosphate thymidylyltransferase [Algimonas porphyrae]